jgi:hypothetical protein
MTEELDRGFKCINCHKWVPVNVHMGTLNRNHCPSCLWSKHVDLTRAGDRLSSCEAGMEPVALTLKKSGMDSYGNEQKGEIMIVHECPKCHKISINRIAADDNSEEIIKLFNVTLNIDEDLKNKLSLMGINIASDKDREEIEKQIFGK